MLSALIDGTFCFSQRKHLFVVVTACLKDVLLEPAAVSKICDEHIIAEYLERLNRRILSTNKGEGDG